MRNLMQNPSMRALMIVSMGMSFTACMAENSLPHLQTNNINRVAATKYSSSYQPQNRGPSPYVLVAQNNAGPNLRGLSSNQRHAQRQYYQDYSVQFPNHYAPITRQAITKQSFNHHLDDVRSGYLQTGYPQTGSARTGNLQTGNSEATYARAQQSRVEQPRAVQPRAVEPRAVQPRRLNHHLDETAPQRQYVQHVQRPQTKIVSNQYQGSETAQAAQQREPLNYATQQNERAATFVAVKTSATPSTVTTISPNSINNSLINARGQSPRLAIESLRIQEAEEGLVQAKAQSKLRLNFDSSVGLTQSETDFNVIDRTDTGTRLRRAARLDLSLPIYQGGINKAQENVAKVGIRTAEANYEIVESAVTEEAAIAHLNVIRDRQLIQAYSRNVDLLRDQKQNVQAMVRAGENTVTDEALIDARLASIEVRLEQSKANLAISESNYKKLTGRPTPSLIPAGLVKIPSSLQEIKEAAQKNNAQIKAGETQAEAAFHNITVAKSYGRPKLSLQGVLRAAEGQSETIRRDSAAELLLNLNVPLLSGGENKSRVRQAALAQSRAVLETRELHDNLNQRVEQLWANVQSARRSKTPNQAQKVAAQKAYEAITKQRNAGLATSLDVLSVEQTLLDAEINLLQAQNTEDVARFQLLGLMGAL